MTYITMAKENKVDGIISITYSSIEEYLLSNIPFVTIERNFGETAPYITCDNFGGGELDAQKLYELGLKKFFV